MKKNLLLTCLAVLARFSGIQAQNTAHLAPIQGVYPDAAGKVVLTLDTAGNAGIWNIADGKLLHSFHKKDPEWAVRLLRYKIQHPDYKQSGYSYDFENLGADTFYYAFKTNTTLVTRVACKSGLVSGFERNRASGRIATFGSDKGTARVWITDANTPNGPNMRGATKELAAISADYFHPYFSDKGGLLFCPVTGTLIQVSAGTVVRLGKNYCGPAFTVASWNFNPEETVLSLEKKAEAMLLIDAATGEKLKEYRVPKSIREEGYHIVPCSDGRSFVYVGYGMNASTGQPNNRAWIVTEGKETALER